MTGPGGRFTKGNIMQTQARSRLIAVDIIAQIILSFAIGLAVSLALAATVVLLSSTAQAQTAQASAETPGVAMKSNEAQSGTLLFRSHTDGVRGTAKGDTFAVPQVATEVSIRVSGIVARATVRQTFRNPYDDWYEGIYVFPLPENAAVDHLKMKIGGRDVLGVIKEKQAAKAAYEQARASGQRAALLEQERPNIFTSSVANVGPREDIVVEIEYQQKLRYQDDNGSGKLSLRFPTVVGPRYIPGSVQVAGLSNNAGRGWSPNTNVVNDAQRITPTVLDPRTTPEPAHAFTLKVELDAGVPLAAVDSPYHPVDVKTLDAGRREIVLRGRQWATRDFELNWTLAPAAVPKTAFFTEQKNGKTYGLLMVVPPTANARQALPREVIFVIDTSGSMNGASIAQAREALALAIDRLSEQDAFNVIEFNSYARALFQEKGPAGSARPEARPANRANRYEAATWVRNLQANGGTEMRAALELALNGSENSKRVRQVIFLTDGQVGNEEQLFKFIVDRLGDTRLFTVGIGSAPNGHFMTKAAEAGRGTYTYIGKVDEVREKMSALFAKLESPVLKGVQVAWPNSGGASDAAVEAWPKRVPDLYLSEPIMLSAAMDGARGEVKLSGMSGDSPWQVSLPLASASAGSGMGVLWAREKIGALTDGLREGRSEDEVRPAVVEVALAHHLVTKYTSLVAIDRPVDRNVNRPADAPIKSAAIPVNLPDGMNHDMVAGEAAAAGELPQGATGLQFDLLMGLLMLLAAATLWQFTA